MITVSSEILFARGHDCLPPHCQTWSAEKLDAAKMAIRFGSAAEQRKNIHATLSKSIHLAPCTVSPPSRLIFQNAAPPL